MYKAEIRDTENQISAYGMDIEAELTSILSEELAKQIDKEILRCLGLKERSVTRKNKINNIFSQT